MAKKSNKGVGFLPFKGYVALAAPESVYPGEDIIMTEAALKAHVDNQTNKVINGELIVAVIGAPVEGYTYFVKVNDIVVLSSNVRPQPVEIKEDGKKFPKLYWVVRESEILVKITK